MAVARRFTIGRLMVVVLLVAADLAVLRGCWDFLEPIDWEAISILTLPMANLLLLALPCLRRPGRSRWFWAGFEGAGWLGVLGLGVAIAVGFDVVLWPVDWIEDRLRNWDDPGGLVVLILLADSTYTAALLLFAGGMGWLAARCRPMVAVVAGERIGHSRRDRVVR